jgi:hypothetical protein
VHVHSVGFSLQLRRRGLGARALSLGSVFLRLRLRALPPARRARVRAPVGKTSHVPLCLCGRRAWVRRTASAARLASRLCVSRSSRLSAASVARWLASSATARPPTAHPTPRTHQCAQLRPKLTCMRPSDAYASASVCRAGGRAPRVSVSVTRSPARDHCTDQPRLTAWAARLPPTRRAGLRTCARPPAPLRL